MAGAILWRLGTAATPAESICAESKLRLQIVSALVRAQQKRAEAYDCEFDARE